MLIGRPRVPSRSVAADSRWLSFLARVRAGELGRASIREPLGRLLRGALQLARRIPHAWRWGILVTLLLALGLRYEARTSALESRLLSGVATRLSYTVEPGPSERIVFPREGPFDERRGYTRLPDLV